jgi:non-specific serine/threonine protein kinase
MRLPLTYLGRDADYVEVVRAYQAAAGAPREESRLVLALGLTRMGRSEEARVVAGPLLDGPLDDRWLSGLVFRLELAVLWQELAAADALVKHLEPVVHLAMVDGCTASVARIAGNASALIGDFTAARRQYALSIERCQRIRYRPELALSRLDLAELMFDHFPDEHQVALEQLRSAVSELEAMHMQPALERARARHELGHAVGIHRETPANAVGLTAREWQVAGLIATGRTNRAIAAELVIAEPTAERHVANILNKLGLHSRAQVAAWYERHREG